MRKTAVTLPSYRLIQLNQRFNTLYGMQSDVQSLTF
jgi:hypothetical protein